MNLGAGDVTFAETTVSVGSVGTVVGGGTGGDGINALPFVSPPDSTTVRLQPSTTDFPPAAQGGVRTGVIFYSAPPRATSANDLIMSWK